MDRRQSGLLIAAVVVTAVALLWYLRTDSGATGANVARAGGVAAPASTQELLNELSQEQDIHPGVIAALQRLQEELQLLLEELEQQQQQHDLLLQQLVTRDSDMFPLAAEPTSQDEAATIEPASETGSTPPEDARRRRRQGVTQERLEAAGFSPYEAEEILSTADRIAMDRLNLQYEATREGWLRTGDYAEALKQIPSVRDVLTEEYGDSGYDRYLYASGRPNRLLVNDIFRESPAAVAGLEPGDKVLAMDGQPVYSDRDLRNIASTGSAGETVPIVVERNGSQFELYVPRGPLGIRTGRGFENPGPGS